MIILPAGAKGEREQNIKNGLRQEISKRLEKLLNDHKRTDKFWVLGKVKPEIVNGGEVMRIFMGSCQEVPPFTTGTFVYYVDMRKGTKEFMWWVDRDGTVHKPGNDAKIKKLETKGRTYAVPPTELQASNN